MAFFYGFALHFCSFAAYTRRNDAGISHICGPILHSYAECAFFTLLSLIFYYCSIFVFVSSLLHLYSLRWGCRTHLSFFFSFWVLLPSCRLNDSFKNVLPSFVYKIKNGCFITRQPFATKDITNIRLRYEYSNKMNADEKCLFYSSQVRTFFERQKKFSFECLQMMCDKKRCDKLPLTFLYESSRSRLNNAN